MHQHKGSSHIQELKRLRSVLRFFSLETGRTMPRTRMMTALFLVPPLLSFWTSSKRRCLTGTLATSTFTTETSAFKGKLRPTSWVILIHFPRNTCISSGLFSRNTRGTNLGSVLKGATAMSIRGGRRVSTQGTVFCRESIQIFTWMSRSACASKPNKCGDEGNCTQSSGDILRGFKWGLFHFSVVTLLTSF